MRILLLSLLISLSTTTACKQTGEDATLKTAAGKSAKIDNKKDSKDAKQGTVKIADSSTDKAPTPATDDGILWKLSGFWKVEENKVKNLGPHMWVDATSIFFSSTKRPRTTAKTISNMEAKQTSAWNAIKSGKFTAGLKTFLNKVRKGERVRVATNFEVGTENLLITSKYWIDGYILGKKMFANKNVRTFEVVAKAGIGNDTDAKIMSPTGSVDVTVAGKSLVSKAITATQGFKYAAPIPPILDASVPVYGVPGLGIIIKLGITARAELVVNLTARKIGSATLTMSPTVGVDMYVGPGAQVGPLTATIEAKLLVFETAWPVSATIGGSKKLGAFWGGVTYDGQDIKALQGALLIKATVEPPAILLPFFFSVKLLAPELNIKAAETSWSWEHEIWAAKDAWYLKKGTGYTGPSYLKVKDAASCKAVDDKITAHIADVKGPAPAPDKNYVEVKTSIEKMLLAIKAKKCP